MQNCFENVWNSLRKEVLVDLERRFGNKVEHDHLLSCLVYDFIFVQLLISPLFVATWRGTWENEDTLLDTIIFNDNLKASGTFCLVFGTLVSAILILFQHEIRKFALAGSRFRFFFISRIYTFLRFTFDVMTWKGTEGFWNAIVGLDWTVALGNMIVPTLILLAIGCFRTTHSSPVGMGIDRPTSCITVPTIFSTTPDNSFLHRLWDTLLTAVISCLAVCSFYGLWVVQDLVLGDVGRELDDPVRGFNGAISYIFGLGCCILSFIMQFLCLHLDKTRDWSGKSTHLTSQSSKEKRGAKLSQILFGFQIRPFLNLMAYDFLLNIAQIGNVSIFRGLWNMIDAFVWPEYVHMSRSVCQFMGFLYILLLYSGTSLHGGIVQETKRTKEGVLLPNFFLTYLLATKLDSSKNDEQILEDDKEDSGENNNTNFETFEIFETFETFETFDKLENL